MKLGSKETEKIKRKLASLNGRFSVPDGNFTLAVVYSEFGKERGTSLIGKKLKE